MAYDKETRRREKIGQALRDGFGVEDIAVRSNMDAAYVRNVVEYFRGLGAFEIWWQVPEKRNPRR